MYFETITAQDVTRRKESLCDIVTAFRAVIAYHAIIKEARNMGIFNFFKEPDINQGVQEYKNAAGAVLLDVRSPQEYREGHIPGSQNVPLQQLDKVEEVTDNIDTILYVYCRSGARSRQAVSLLQAMGYTNVHNIGGIAAYSGKVE